MCFIKLQVGKVYFIEGLTKSNSIDSKNSRLPNETSIDFSTEATVSSIFYL